MATFTYNKIQVDNVSRVITVISAPVDGEIKLDVKVDLYSDLKEIWLNNIEARRLKVPITPVGGDDLPGADKLGSTYFLDPTWKIRPYEANHRFLVDGNIYSPDGTSPFIFTVGAYNVLLENKVSNLVSAIETTNSSLTAEQITMLTEMYRLMGLDPTRPLPLLPTVSLR